MHKIETPIDLITPVRVWWWTYVDNMIVCLHKTVFIKRRVNASLGKQPEIALITAYDATGIRSKHCSFFADTNYKLLMIPSPWRPVGLWRLTYPDSVCQRCLVNFTYLFIGKSTCCAAITLTTATTTASWTTNKNIKMAGRSTVCRALIGC